MAKARVRQRLGMALLLLLAFGLRAAWLTSLPPGLTHDEANHGREAIGILAGRLALFFPLNYGSEPLYSYTVAGLMAFVGRNVLALRLVTVWFNLATIALTYRWARQLWPRPGPFLAAALLVLSFWPVASGREALRAGMMPFFTMGAVYFFWQLVAGKSARPGLTTLAFSLCLTATLYNYLAARLLWLLFPAFLLYLFLAHRAIFGRIWQPTTLGLLLTFAAVLPMFFYLQSHPEAQTRLDMLDGTLQKLLAGQISPFLENGRDGLLAFFWPGYGDQFLAYNLPGRPVFDPLTAILGAIGLLVCLSRWREPRYALLPLWFFIGILPSLITGPTANTTRNVAAMSPAFLLPAVGFAALHPKWPRPAALLSVGWLVFVGGLTIRDYFGHWGQLPSVRAAYQATLVATLHDLADEPADQPLVLSTVYPGPAHDPSIGLVFSGQQDNWRWVDSRLALLFPAGQGSQLLSDAATPPHAAFGAWLDPLEKVLLRPDDLNPSYTRYQMQPNQWPLSANPSLFGQNGRPALRLLGSQWLAASYRPGDVAELMLVWQVLDPAGVGPQLPVIETTDVVMFTHVLNPAGQIVSQQDALHAPSWDWQAGDVVVQIQQLWLAGDVPAGSYSTIVGLYDRDSGARLPTLNQQLQVASDYAPVVSLQIDD